VSINHLHQYEGALICRIQTIAARTPDHYMIIQVGTIQLAHRNPLTCKFEIDDKGVNLFPLPSQQIRMDYFMQVSMVNVCDVIELPFLRDVHYANL
jgi:hypothetical protein